MEQRAEKRQRRNREQWERVIEEQERSGLGAQEFCARESVGLASFYQWRRRIRDSAGAATAASSFIDMGSVDSGRASSDDAGSWAVTLELGDGARLMLKRS